MTTQSTDTNSHEIFRQEDLSICFQKSTAATSRNILVFTYTPHAITGENVLNKPGFGTHFLAKNGFDVIAFKSSTNSWYQNLPLSAIENVNDFLKNKNYRLRTAYGSSMAAYAVIQFSRLLRVDLALAFSPQYRIDQDYDTRWAAEAARIKFAYQIDQHCIRPECRYIVILDNHGKDTEHLKRIRPFMDPSQLQEIHLPHAGHNTVLFLQEGGALKNFVVDALSGNPVSPPNTRSSRRASSVYLSNLAELLISRKHPRQAVWMAEKCIAMRPKHPEFYRLKANALKDIPDLDGAILATRIALEKSNRHPVDLKSLGLLLLKQNNFHEALDLAGERIEKKPNSTENWILKIEILEKSNRIADASETALAACERLSFPRPAVKKAIKLLKALNQPEQALETVKRALTLHPKDISLLLEKAQILEDFGQIDEAIALLHSIEGLAISNEEKCRIFNLLSTLYRSVEQWDPAIHYIDACLELTPLRPDLLNRRTVFLSRRDKSSIS